MSNSMRWRWGETNPVSVEISSSVSVSMGDLVYLNAGAVQSASAFTLKSSLTATQSSFRAQFLGIAMQAKPSGVSGKIRVATSGVFQFPCTETTYQFGALVGAAYNSNSTALENQKLTSAVSTQGAIGRVIRAESSSVDSIYVQIASTVFTGGLSIEAESVASAASSSSAAASGN